MEVWYPPEVIQVVGDQGQIVNKRRGRDEDVGIANGDSPLAQESVDLGSLDYDFIVQRKHEVS